MEKSVLFIDEYEDVYREQLRNADFIKMSSRSLVEATQIRNLREELRESVELVFVRVLNPFPVKLLDDLIMPHIPNAGVLFLGENPEVLLRHLKSVLGGLPTYVYGARKSVTPWEMREAIDIAFAANHHETAKANLKERWTVCL